MTGSMECFTLLLPDFGRQGPSGFGLAGFGSLGRVWAGKVGRGEPGRGSARSGAARQAWLVQVCCGASGCVKVRYGGAGKASSVKGRRGLVGLAGMARLGEAWRALVCFGRLKMKGDIYGLQIQIRVTHQS